MFELKFDTDNDAFTENAPAEIARTLQAIAEQIKVNAQAAQAGYWQSIKDPNGNRIGAWRYLDTANR